MQKARVKFKKGDATHRVVAGHDGPGGGVSGVWDSVGPLPHDALVSGAPVPQEDGAVLRAGRHVEVGVHVVLGPRQASHHPVVTEHDLGDLGRVRGKHPEE